MPTCNKPTCLFPRTKTNLVLADVLKNTLVAGDGRLKKPIENGELSILGIFDAIKSQECVRVRNYEPDSGNKHLAAISLGPSYLEQQISRAIDKAVKNRAIPSAYVDYVRQQIGLSKPSKKEKLKKAQKQIKEDINKELQDLPGVHVAVNLPQVRQSQHFSCGAAVIQMVMAYYGSNVREEDLIEKLNIGENSGVKLSKIQEVADDVGLKTNKTYLDYNELIKTVIGKVPVMVAILKQDEDYHHFVLVVGYYDGGVVFRDPSKFTYGYLPKEEFESRCFGSDGKYLTLSMSSNKQPEYSPTEVEKS